MKKLLSLLIIFVILVPSVAYAEENDTSTETDTEDIKRFTDLMTVKELTSCTEDTELTDEYAKTLAYHLKYDDSAVPSVFIVPDWYRWKQIKVSNKIKAIYNVRYKVKKSKKNELKEKFHTIYWRVIYDWKEDGKDTWHTSELYIGRHKTVATPFKSSKWKLDYYRPYSRSLKLWYNVKYSVKAPKAFTKLVNKYMKEYI